MQGVAVVQRAMRADPVAVMAQLGFGSLVLVARTPVSMSGVMPAPTHPVIMNACIYCFIAPPDAYLP